MSCDYYQHLSPYLDGELDGLETNNIKEHLETCTFCRGELNHMLQIRDSLKQISNSMKAPSHLKQKILGDMRQGRRIMSFVRWNFAYATALVATVLFIFGLLFYYWRVESDPFTEITATLMNYHAAYESGKRTLSIKSAGLENIESWFNGRLDFMISIPNAAFAGYRLEGADILKNDNEKIAYLMYQKKGTSMGYMIFQDLDFLIELSETKNVGEIKLYFGEKKGTNFAVWKKGGLVFFLATSEDRSELIEYARRCILLF